MVSLTGHAHDGRTHAATAWVRCAGAAVALGTMMVLAGRGIVTHQRDRPDATVIRSRRMGVVAVAPRTAVTRCR
jgi:hypothetical protein